MNDKEKTQVILDSLIKHLTEWGKSRTNVLFPELRLGSGYCGVAQRRIDLFCISSNSGNTTTAYEIKVSRSDFKHDLDSDLKQRGARLYANEFYYVTPKGLLKPEEIPLWAGLMELDFDLLDKGIYFSTPVPAPLHSKAMPSWGLICSMIRHVNKDIGVQTIEDLKQEIKQLKAEKDRAENLLKRIANNDYMEFELIKYKK